MRLIVVESPKKARTLTGFAGPGYRVVATMGHVRDLPTKSLGLEIGDGIIPQYETIERARRTISEIRAAARGAEAVLLATDPDREGEAIAWHVVEAAGLPVGRTARIAFHEVSERALRTALANPRAIDRCLVDAQQARRVLDRLVGYGLSPLLWRAVQGGTSGGRVQSVALRIVVDREREVRAFVPEEFWTVDVRLSTIATGEDGAEAPFVARLLRVGDDVASITSEALAQAVVGALDRALYRVSEMVTEASERPPPPPFTTSTLQQAAASRLRLPAKRTMQLAQSLYEAGLITYMRTDSVAVASDAVQAVRSVIAADFGPAALPKVPRHYRTRARNAQEAHEAIRPVDPARRPATLGTLARGDEGRLYALIWARMVASQMSPARIRTDRAMIEAAPMPADAADASGEDADPGSGRYLLEARATTVVSPGWLAVHGSEAGPARPAGSDDDADGDAPASNASLPDLAAGEVLALEGIDPVQRFTRPPPRFTEASLVRALETAGVGRPSTYAAILSTIEERGYVGQANRAFVPTPLGFAVIDYLARRFPEVVDVQFTARMEERLDDVAAGDLDWQAMLVEFHRGFERAIAVANASITGDRVAVATSVAEAGVEVPIEARRPAKAPSGGRRRALPFPGPVAALANGSEAIGSAGLSREGAALACPKCGKPMVARRSKYGEFWGCSGYPACREIHRDEGAGSETPDRAARSSAGNGPRVTGGGTRRRGASAEAATGAPGARRPRSVRAPVTEGLPVEGTVGAIASTEGVPEACPKCGKPMVARRSTYGEFWGCSGYPACREIHRSEGAPSPAPVKSRRPAPRTRGTSPDPMTARVVRSRKTFRGAGPEFPHVD